MPSKLLSVKETLDILGISLRELSRERERGNIKAVKLGRMVKFRPEEVERYINDMNRQRPNERIIMNFFNFGNNATYHIFHWFARTDMARHIELAFGDADKPTEHFPDEDICVVVRDRLADSLMHTTLNIVENEHDAVITDVMIGDVDDSTPSLWLPLLANALQDVNFVAVAEALLIKAGKWNPSKVIPEMR